MIKKENININYFYSSLQLRANNTLKLIQEVLEDNKNFIRAWQLNERHYGALTGLNKIEMSEKLGEEKVHQFRRSWDLRPDPLSKDSPFHPSNINTYKNVPNENLPDTESLKDTYLRVMKFYEKEIKEKLNKGNILISAHGNSLRATMIQVGLYKPEEISDIELPTGRPFCIVFTDNKLEDSFYFS